MSKEIKQGNYVQVIDSMLKGFVTKISSNIATIVDKDGFEWKHKVDELFLVKSNKETKIHLVVSDNEKWVNQKKKNPIQANYKSSKKVQTKIDAEYDLHIEKLTGNYKRMSNADILDMQIVFFRKRIESAINCNYKNIVFIHGRGEGILKDKIRNELSVISDLEYRDASFFDYGEGATLVSIYKKIKK